MFRAVLKILAGVVISGLLFVLFAVGSWVFSEDGSAPIVTFSTLRLSNGLEVHVRKQVGQGFRESGSEYEFTCQGRHIASTCFAESWAVDVPVQMGHSQGIFYFSQSNLLCLYDRSEWVVWETQRVGSGWGPYQNIVGDLRVVNFTARGNTWTIFLDTDNKYPPHTWKTYGTPPFIQVVSTDRGRNWRLWKNEPSRQRHFISRRASSGRAPRPTRAALGLAR